MGKTKVIRNRTIMREKISKRIRMKKKRRNVTRKR